ncbi:MAG: HD domain-containing protein, partial [Deltaproteobacteria bacterium]|nr:HD domain-containing protein [Deltaproteobacteria bacterium]
LEIIQSDENITLALLDQVMPNMTGLELALEIKELKRYITLMMLTGNASKELAIESIRKKVFWEFLEKPVDFSSNFMKQMMYTGVQEHYLQKASHGFRKGAVELLANLIDDKDGHTHRHSYRVQSWSLKIAGKFDFAPHEIMMIEEGALLHDIGKISIPDDILKKPGRLSQLERKIIMSHPARGGALLESVDQLKELAPMARYHHERPDGTGYPQGLKGDEIPLTAAIVAIADFYEALSSKRPYKEPWPIEDIVEEILRVRGKQFSEEVVDAFMQVILDEECIAPQKFEEIKKSVSAAA